MKGAWPKSMPVEAYFLKYAFPCAFITLQRGRITKAEFEMLEDAAVNGEAVARSDLDRIFAPAMRRLHKLAEETGFEMWSRELVEEYYFKNHNQIIDEGEGDYGKAPEVLCELCKIFPAVVVQSGVQKELHTSEELRTFEAETNNVGVVVELPGGKLRAVNTALTGALKKGDRVMVHYGYACEKLTE